jgi:SAM-dependent MidA family methyltransferase
MNGDVHVRFCEQLRVKLPGLTRLADTEAGAHASAMFYSLLCTAKVNDVNIYEAMKYLFTEIPKAKNIEDYERLAEVIMGVTPIA